MLTPSDDLLEDLDWLDSTKVMSRLYMLFVSY